MTSRAYLLLTLLFYAVGALHVLAHALTRRRLLSSWTLSATLVGFAVHTAGPLPALDRSGALPRRGTARRHLPLAWAIVLVFLLTFLRTRVDALGLAVYPVAFALLLVANLTPASERADPILLSLYPARTRHPGLLRLRGPLRGLRHGRALPRPGAGAQGALAARLLLPRSEPRALRHHLAAGASRSASYSSPWPSSPACSGTCRRAAALHGDAKEWSALIAWVIYVMLIVARQRAGWGGRRAALPGHRRVSLRWSSPSCG